MERKFILRIIALAVCIVFASLTHAQVIKGKVTDAATGEPLFGAVVGEKGTSNGVTTDFEGEFTLTVAALPVNLQIALIGYLNR